MRKQRTQAIKTTATKQPSLQLSLNSIQVYLSTLTKEMAVMMFGTLASKLTWVPVEPVHTATCMTIAPSLVESDQPQQNKEYSALETLDAFFNTPAMLEKMRRHRFATTKTKKNGTVYLKHEPEAIVNQREKEAQAYEAFERFFNAGGYDGEFNAGCVEQGGTCHEPVSAPCERGFTHTCVKPKRRKQKRLRQRTKGDIDSITRNLMKSMSRNTGAVEFIDGKRKLTAKFKMFKTSTIPCIVLPHEKGLRLKRELPARVMDPWISALASGRRLRHKVVDKDIVRGWSGAILPNYVVDRFSRHDNFVVRGRLHGHLIDARAKISFFSTLSINQYSFKTEFWEGWKKAFDALHPIETNHNCDVTLSNSKCGELAALLVQMMHPCQKLSCSICRSAISDMSSDEITNMILKQQADHAQEVLKIAGDCPSINKILKHFGARREENPNTEGTMAILRLLQGKKATQLQHLSTINTVLAKGHSSTSDELSDATNKLLEITRWFHNHLSFVNAGALETFRNKITSKALVNPTLMCDNQLDRNGNFVWGERGRHSKRFFANYFEIVKPEEGYDKFVKRVHPNGTRLLAIQNLIVPLALDRARASLKGEAIAKQPLSEACVSRLDGAFVHVCCCVTDDIGAPLLSMIKSPTKSHLVVGTTTNAKYIDLPQIEESQMYIAKEGYCYLNIFLAMLVNVNEENAKDFTKRIRDIMIPRLGKWPSMMDVATVCHMLAIFYPEVRNAELPRILVDHASQTMHVIDSYGSLTTGYHILKAGTVQQLISFASDELQSEMKHYRVGGDPEEPRLVRTERILLASIFRPKVLIELIQSDPYILMMSLVSPTLLVNLYNVGGLEIAMREWITKDMAVSTIFSLLITLTQQVAVADILSQQFSIISSKTDRLLDLLSDVEFRTETTVDVQAMCQVLAARGYTDRQLEDNGFSNMMMPVHQLREKMYMEQLSDAWHELSWWERFSQIMHARRVCQNGMVIQQRVREGGTTGTCLGLRTWSLGKMKSVWNGTRTRANSISDSLIQSVICRFYNSVLAIVSKCYKDIFYCVNVLIICNVLVSMAYTIQNMLQNMKASKIKLQILAHEEEAMTLQNIYNQLMLKNNTIPTREEMVEHVKNVNKQLLPHLEEGDETELVAYQSKSNNEMALEKIVAGMALLTMIFDPEKSDAVFRVLSKMKTFFCTMGETVRYQSLDDIQDTSDDKQMFVDIELDSSASTSGAVMDIQFGQWWSRQLDQNRTVPHYRLNGDFLEFTRSTAAAVSHAIATSEKSEFLIRGAVGSGKSTGLPNQLQMKGRVLLLEPTRPLAENVCRQLRGEPFCLQPTLRMRGFSTFGSSNITVMTGGFALHYYAHNPALLNEFQFIIIDECHTLDAATMAFYCLIKEFNFGGKVLKVSATPPGKECEFVTQHNVQIKTEDALSFHNFVLAQGSGSNADVVAHGDNILVYVASYNDVDQLGDMLARANHRVTKVDGRTMKLGQVEIQTKGTAHQKHFIVATNIIENGVTLDIDVVVDFGVKVIAELDTDSRCMRYRKVAISYGERIQRLGRVGRVKNGVALRIGHTEKGITDIPVAIATEAAFLCFAYGLPVMTHNVTTGLLDNCTSLKARTMMQFELSPFFMADLVNYRGAMHPLIHNVLKPFKLRDSETELQTLAIPNAVTSNWLTVLEYERMGIKINAPKTTKMPFYARGIPEKVIEQLWEIVEQNKADAGFGRLTSACATKVAYTLSTEPSAIPRTVAIIDQLISEEQQKKAHFEALSVNICTHKFTLKGIIDNVRSRYMTDHSSANIERLQRARAQILNFHATHADFTKINSMLNLGCLETVQYQSKEEISRVLKLQGRWNKTLITQDLLISGMVVAGGAWMVWEYFKNGYHDAVTYQSKRKSQKLKFRDARDKKIGREVYGDDGTIEHFFGEAYTKRGKVKGKHSTKHLGKKSRNFVHMYGFDPAEYSFIRFLDPITGATLDEPTTCDISMVQEEFGALRTKWAEDDEYYTQRLIQSPGIEAYFVNTKAQKALKVDLTPHNPLAVGRQTASISGYPEREFELRQTGPAVPIPFSSVPQTNEMDTVQMEGKSIHKGLRNYNPIATAVCKITNNSDGILTTVHGIGFGALLIANGHLFRRNNGTLKIQTHHGVFTIQNTTQLDVHHIKGKDMVVVKLPKDFPPFPMKLKFRSPVKGEKACLVGSLFQQRSISSVVSETTVVTPSQGGSYWQHWVSTKDGDCGLPLVAVKDGALLGIHGLESTKVDKNYFIPFTDNFCTETLEKSDTLEWQKHWLHTIDKISWGGLQLVESTPAPIFRTSKILCDLQGVTPDQVKEQASESHWVRSKLRDNLVAVGHTSSQLVTKHVVKGECAHFARYLMENEEAHNFFTPLMGAYKPSKLNKEAYLLDFFKYADPITVGLVKTEVFDQAVSSVVALLQEIGFEKCTYVTDTDEIINSLNLKSAVGAMYSGKKREYLELLDEHGKQDLIMASCQRLYEGKKGIWNGSLKAELRPIEKVTLNKTRTFTAAPIDTLLAGKVCVDDFNNQFYSLNLAGPWTVGMTKFYGGWNRLLTKLPENWVYCHADGSRFDSSLTPYLINSIIKIRLAFMENWEIGERMLRNLYTEIIYTPILTPDGTVVKKHKGNNSGQPSTVVDNTLMVILTMYYSLHRFGWSVNEIKSRFVFFANGDDLIIAVDPEYQPVLDSLAPTFSELGLSYDFSERSTNREELWYMSHQGMLRDGIYIPKLEPERIVSILEWDRCVTIEHRAEAICAAMIEAWGYDDLLREIRKFYLWFLEQEEFLSSGYADTFPYITETALRKLYTDIDADMSDLMEYAFTTEYENQFDMVAYQSGDQLDAGTSSGGKKANPPPPEMQISAKPDQDVNAGKIAMSIPRLKKLSSKMRLPVVAGKPVVNLAHLIDYKPEQIDLSNTRATHQQFSKWYEAIKKEYELDDASMSTVMNGFMVWCIENGTSPNINGVWVMMDGDQQVEFPLKPIVENAKPTLRQIMHHFSDAAEAYIEMRNAEQPYMPRYGLQRNLRDRGLARYAFDFYEMTSKTPDRAKEAHLQMKAAALSNSSTRMFGLDGNIATQTEDTERHVATDVNANMHNLLGVKM